MESTHDNLNALLQLGEYLGKRVLFISEKTKDRAKFYNWIPLRKARQFIYQFFKTVDMTMAVIKSKGDYDLIFIFEHKPWYSFFLYFACILKNKPTFFIIHDTQQTYRRSYIRTIGFKALLFFTDKFNFWPVHLEKADHDFTDCLKFSKSKIVLQIPFPAELQEKVIKSRSYDKIKIGIAGMIRPDKPIMQVLEILEDYSKENPTIELLVGTPFWQLPENLKKIPFQLVDTGSTAQYSSFLSSLDVVVACYEKDSFYYRSSGVLNDAISAGCFTIVPDFPILREQISNPVTVGATYNKIEEIKNTLDWSIAHIKNNDIEFETWRKLRYDDVILKNLSRQMNDVLIAAN